MDEKEEKKDDLLELLEENKQLLEKEDEVRKKVKIVGWVFPPVIIFIFGLFFYLMYSSIRNIDGEKFIDLLERESGPLLNKLSSEVSRVGDVLLPYYAKEFENMAFDAVPKLESQIDYEMKLMKDNLASKIKIKLNEKLAANAKQQQALLENEFPGLKDNQEKSEEIKTRIEEITKQWINEKLVEALDNHLVALEQLKKTLNTHMVKKGETEEKVNPEDLLSVWLEIMGEKIHGDDATIMPKKKKKKKAQAQPE